MRQIRSLPGGDAVRLVAATANVFDDDRREVIEAGGDGFLPKPFTKAQLLDVVSTVISTTAGNCVTRDDVPVDDVPVDDVPSDDG
jgi:CheY-like chemotaxis protein